MKSPIFRKNYAWFGKKFEETGYTCDRLWFIRPFVEVEVVTEVNNTITTAALHTESACNLNIVQTSLLKILL